MLLRELTAIYFYESYKIHKYTRWVNCSFWMFKKAVHSCHCDETVKAIPL